MGLVIDYIIQSSDGEVKAYDSQKRFIDETENDTFGEFDDHINEVTIKDKSLLFIYICLLYTSPSPRDTR